MRPGEDRFRRGCVKGRQHSIMHAIVIISGGTMRFPSCWSQGDSLRRYHRRQWWRRQCHMVRRLQPEISRKAHRDIAAILTSREFISCRYFSTRRTPSRIRSLFPRLKNSRLTYASIEGGQRGECQHEEDSNGYNFGRRPDECEIGFFSTRIVTMEFSRLLSQAYSNIDRVSSSFALYSHD